MRFVIDAGFFGDAIVATRQDLGCLTGNTSNHLKVMAEAAIKKAKGEA